MPAEPTNDFLRLLFELTAASVDFAIVGGTAAILHGASRFARAACLGLRTDPMGSGRTLPWGECALPPVALVTLDALAEESLGA
jgi:hypothetical protein